LKVWAVRALGDTLHVLLIDKGTRSVRMYLHLPARGPATVERLLAPSVRSVDAVTLDGQRLGSDGRWQGSPAHETISLTGHAYQLTVPQLSAALVVVHLR
jgi:Glycosyl hydrolase family 79 C-terminal beta domain